LIRQFKKSDPIKQRHRSPSGHAFPVPSQSEIDSVWERAVEKISALDYFPLTPDELDDGFVLPGLPSLIQYWGQFAHRSEPSDVVVQIGTAFQALLEEDQD